MGQAKRKLAAVPKTELLKLDLGCGPHPREGFHGVDIQQYDGKVGTLFDLRKVPWPWETESVDEVHCSHFIEHLTGIERIVFMNELYRVMKFGATASIIAPNWSHERAYGDPTHQWPPISSFAALYWNAEWRKANAPHVGFNCDFDYSTGVGFDPWLHTRNDEMKQFAMVRYTNSAADIYFNLTKTKRK